MDKSGLERTISAGVHDLIRIRVAQKDPPRSRSVLYYGKEWARKSLNCYRDE